MSIKSILGKTVFCFNISTNAWEGGKLLYWTFILVFYSRFFQQALAKNKQIKSLCMNTHQGPMEIKLRLQDIPIFYEMFFYNVYNIPEENISQGSILDIGAHIGLASIFFWDKYFPDAKFYCVEPSKENLKLLEYNTRLLNRTIINIGISDHNGHAAFDTSGYGHNFKIGQNGKSNEKVNTCTIDRLFEKYRIGDVALLKMDIEGEEKKILKNENKWLDKADYVIVEVHSSKGDIVWRNNFEKKFRKNK